MNRYIFILHLFAHVFFIGSTVNAQEAFHSKHSDVYFVQNLTGNVWETAPYFFINYQRKWPAYINTNTYRMGSQYYFTNFNSDLSFYASQNNMNNVFKQTTFKMGYTYHAKLNYHSTLLFGLKAGINIHSKNYSSLTYENTNSYSDQTEYNPNFSFSLGVKFLEKHYLALISNKIINSAPAHDGVLSGASFVYQGKLTRQIGNYMSQIEPHISLNYFPGYTSLFYGGKVEYANFILGANINQLLPVKFNSLTLLLGINLDKTKIFYSYDINLYKNTVYNTDFSTHEVTFLQEIRYKNQKRSRKAIKCPDI